MTFGCSFGIFLNSADLVCRSTDISMCFRGSLRLRDNESRLINLRADGRTERKTKYPSTFFDSRGNINVDWKQRTHTKETALITNKVIDSMNVILFWGLKYYNEKLNSTKQQTTKFSSANFQKLLSPSYITLGIQRLEGKQCRSR